MRLVFFFFFVQPQSRSQSFVPLDQRSENVSSGSNHYERTKVITEFWLSGSLRICIYGACLKWLLPELSFSDRWSRGTKLWERDRFSHNLVPRAHVPFGQHQDTELRVLVLTKRHVGSGNEIGSATVCNSLINTHARRFY